MKRTASVRDVWIVVNVRDEHLQHRALLLRAILCATPFIIQAKLASQVGEVDRVHGAADAMS